MEKIIVNKDDFEAIEVIENNRIAPCMGMSQFAFRAMVVQEREVAKQIESLLRKGRSPKILHQLMDFDAFSEEDKIRLCYIFKVFRKVLKLLKEGFHVRIIDAMMRSSAGYESHYGSQFDEKFSRALYSEEVREDFWGTKYLQPIIAVEHLLVDLMANIKINAPTEDDLRKSDIVAYAFSACQEEDREKKLEEFIRFCM